jgi:hypothetical protein
MAITSYPSASAALAIAVAALNNSGTPYNTLINGSLTTLYTGPNYLPPVGVLPDVPLITIPVLFAPSGSIDSYGLITFSGIPECAGQYAWIWLDANIVGNDAGYHLGNFGNGYQCQLLGNFVQAGADFYPFMPGLILPPPTTVAKNFGQNQDTQELLRIRFGTNALLMSTAIDIQITTQAGSFNGTLSASLDLLDANGPARIFRFDHGAIGDYVGTRCAASIKGNSGLSNVLLEASVATSGHEINTFISTTDSDAQYFRDIVFTVTSTDPNDYFLISSLEVTSRP